MAVSPFEQQVAAALATMMNDRGEFLLSALAPRVVAAIDVIAQWVAETVEGEWGTGQQRGPLYDHTLQNTRNAALAALRGEQP